MKSSELLSSSENFISNGLKHFKTSEPKAHFDKLSKNIDEFGNAVKINGIHSFLAAGQNSI